MGLRWRPVVVVTDGPDSVHDDSSTGDGLRAITGVIRTGNGLWGVGGVAYCA